MRRARPPAHAEAIGRLGCEAPSTVSPSLAEEVPVDALAQLDVIVPGLQRLVAGTTTEQLDLPTPCTEWRVRDLFGHLAVGATTFAAVVRGEEPAADVSAGPDPIISATTQAALADIDEAFRGPGALERSVVTPFGEMPGDAFARLLCFDMLMHSWDLATATGQSLEVPDELVAEVDGFARAALTADLRGPGTFGPEVAPGSDAPALERLVAFSGRAA
jgi:uncharacterized protein (TIGR03086 family)